jgi:hypothetical protein
MVVARVAWFSSQKRHVITGWGIASGAHGPSTRVRGERESMLSQRVELAKENRLRRRLHDFALRVQDRLDGLDFEQRQRLLLRQGWAG